MSDLDAIRGRHDNCYPLDGPITGCNYFDAPVMPCDVLRLLQILDAAERLAGAVRRSPKRSDEYDAAMRDALDGYLKELAFTSP